MYSMRQGAQMLFMRGGEFSARFDDQNHLGQSTGDLIPVKMPDTCALARACLIACPALSALVGVLLVRSSDIEEAIGDLSPEARRLVAISGERFHRISGTYAHVFAPDIQTATRWADEADFAVARAAQRLGVHPPERPVVIVAAPTDETWEKWSRSKNLRADSLAVHWRGEIFLRSSTGAADRVDRLAHEVVHHVIWETYGERIPLWLDEGLAWQWGLDIAREYRKIIGMRLAISLPAASEARVEPLDVLTARTSLPEDPESAMVFYRISAEFVAQIEERIGPSAMPAFIRGVAAGRPWRDMLEEILRGSPVPIEDLEEATRREALRERTD